MVSCQICFGGKTIPVSFFLCGLLICLAGCGIVTVLPAARFGRAEPWRAEILVAFWVLTGLLSAVGTVLRIEGELSWCPVFGMDGPVLPMMVLLSFAGGVSGSGRYGVACVLSGFAFLALSPLIFGLLVGTALILLVRKGWIGLCLPVAVVPATVPVDSLLFTPALCVMVLLLGKATSVQTGPSALLPGATGLFLLGRLLTESGVLPSVCQFFLLCCGCGVALSGSMQALRRSSSAGQLMSGLVTSGFGLLVVILVLAFGTTLEGGEQFRTAALLAAGAPFLSALVLLWLCQDTKDASPEREEGASSLILPSRLKGRYAQGIMACALLFLSGLPPLGSFSVLWCFIGAAEQAARAVPPLQALAVIVLTVITSCVMVINILALLRLVLAVVRSRSAQEDKDTAQSIFTLLPALVCVAAAAVVAFFPGGWLAFADNLLAGTFERPFLWSKSITVWFISSSESYTPLYCVMALLLCAGCLQMFSTFFKISPLPQAQFQASFWQQGAPFIQAEKKELNSISPVPSDRQFNAQVDTFLGWQTYKVSVHTGWQKCVAAVSPLWQFVLRFCALCEAQSGVLVLLFLGAGLFLGLFAG